MHGRAKKDPFGAPRINAKNFFGLTTETLNCNYGTEDDLSVNIAIIMFNCSSLFSESQTT